jgi:GH25 family lysozyme M1 (1,4-beta-N-acetylmuramidase)
MEKRGIDISRYQGAPDFAKVKTVVDYVIVQAGYGRYASQKDAEFERTYAECKKHKIPVGAYWFSYAVSPDDARQEARACMEVLKGKQFEYPIYFDIEGSACSGDVSGKCKAFCDELEKNGYFSGIYISRSPAQQYLNDYCCKNYALWLAEYSPTGLHWGSDVGMWQYGSTGRVAGISGDVDMDICYVDYPALIKRGGYNGFPKANPEPLDTEVWWRKGDKDKGIYAVKQRMIALGFVRLDSTSGFGGGTESAVKTLQEQWGYKPTGEIGKNFVDRVMR